MKQSKLDKLVSEANKNTEETGIREKRFDRIVFWVSFVLMLLIFGFLLWRALR